MSDLDVDELAAYLHLTPEKVRKMAQRGKLPGRRRGDQWIFSEAEIHHWLEDQIGASDAEGLDKLDGVLDRRETRMDAPPPADTDLRSLIPLDAIEIPLAARTRGSVIRSMCDVVARTGLLWDAPAMAVSVAAREAMHPTALECGAALLHPRRPQSSILSDSVVGVGVTSSPIPFADNGQLVDVFFLICSYDDTTHLRILAELSRAITTTDLLSKLRSAETPADAHAAIG